MKNNFEIFRKMIIITVIVLWVGFPATWYKMTPHISDFLVKHADIISLFVK